MEVIYAGENIPTGGSVAALGNFDGLHTAHMAIIRKAIGFARERGLKSGVMLFEENTKGAKLITSNRTKLELLEREKPDFVYIRKFTKEFMRLSPREFIELLIEKLSIKAVCVGYDYRFGYRAEGNVELLKKFGAEYGFEVLVTEAMSMDGQLISSTHIRSLIESGDIETANKFLGRSFRIDGYVQKGLQNGRKMGIPTANVGYDKNMTLPKDGVYAGITYVDGKCLKCVINVGSNPTFGAKHTTIESHILDFDEDIYGKYISVSFAKRLRGDIKFPSMEALKEQINKDIEMAYRMEL